MGNIVIALPFYQTVSVDWLFNFVNADRTRCIGQVATRHAYIPEAMTTLVELAFSNYGEQDWDRLLVWEHDMIIPDNALNRIAHYPTDHDIVGSLYFKHDPPHPPMVYMRVDQSGFVPVAPVTVQQMVDNPALYPVDAVGLGFTSISRRLLEAWDESVKMFHPDPAVGIGGHDLWFCSMAKEQGFTVAVDSGMRCGHLSQLPVGLADHQRYPLNAGEVVVWEQGQVKPWKHPL